MNGARRRGQESPNATVRREGFGRERPRGWVNAYPRSPRVVEIVVESTVDPGSDGDLRGGEEPLHSHGASRGGVANLEELLGLVAGEQLELFLDRTSASLTAALAATRLAWLKTLVGNRGERRREARRRAQRRGAAWGHARGRDPTIAAATLGDRRTREPHPLRGPPRGRAPMQLITVE